LQDDFKPGAVVIVKNLPATELNGMQGKLLSYDKQARRWNVQITNKIHPFFLLAENLRLQRVSFNDSQKASAQKGAEVPLEARKKRRTVQEVNSLVSLLYYSVHCKIFSK
jgi:hypothetical protein